MRTHSERRACWRTLIRDSLAGRWLVGRPPGRVGSLPLQLRDSGGLAEALEPERRAEVERARLADPHCYLLDVPAQDCPLVAPFLRPPPAAGDGAGPPHVPEQGSG